MPVYRDPSDPQWDIDPVSEEHEIECDCGFKGTIEVEATREGYDLWLNWFCPKCGTEGEEYRDMDDRDSWSINND